MNRNFACCRLTRIMLVNENYLHGRDLEHKNNFALIEYLKWCKKRVLHEFYVSHDLRKKSKLVYF